MEYIKPLVTIELQGYNHLKNGSAHIIENNDKGMNLFIWLKNWYKCSMDYHEWDESLPEIKCKHCELKGTRDISYKNCKIK
jgi:hypothetical protein